MDAQEKSHTPISWTVDSIHKTYDIMQMIKVVESLHL
jgi:hypothetical protein